MSTNQTKASKRPTELNQMHRCCADCHLFIWLVSRVYSEEENKSYKDVFSFKYCEADSRNPQIQKVKIYGTDERSQEIEKYYRDEIKKGEKCSKLFGEFDLLHCYASQNYWWENRSLAAYDLRTDEGRYETIVETDRNDCQNFYKYTPGMNLGVARKNVEREKGKQPEGKVYNADSKTEKICGITKQRGRKPKHPNNGDFMAILNDILGDDKNSSLGSYVKKVKVEMERKGLVDKKRENGLIYKDYTITKYIRDHSEYKKIQERKE
jgi:hypothetical protein